jgi:hypothetical protein
MLNNSRKAILKQQCSSTYAAVTAEVTYYLGDVWVPDGHQVACPLVELAADHLQQTGTQQPATAPQAAAAAAEHP